MTDDIGTITKCYTVTYTRRSKHSASRLWRAITEPDEVGKWMGGPSKVDLRVGGDWTVEFGGDDGTLDGIIVRVEHEKKLGYVWGWSYVEWAIEDGADGCTYTFVQNGLADRGEDEEGLPAGWHEFFDRLERHLEGVYLTDEEHTARWHALKPPYRKQLEAVIR
jgi:uncharacterized protein YndB with AHSA1/START domain